MRPVRDFLQIGAVGLGIDVGKSSIKAVDLHRTPRGIEVTHLAVQSTPDGAVEGGVILDRGAVAQAVSALLMAASIRGRRAVISVAGQNVLARVLRLPPIPEDELKQAIKWEAERHLPIPVDEAVMDVQLVREVVEEGQRQMEVLLAAAPEGLVMTYIETLDAAHVYVEAVEVGALAMARSLRAEVATGTHAIIDLGASTTCVAMISEGIPQFSRTVPFGVVQMSRAAAGRTAQTGEGLAVAETAAGAAPAGLEGLVVQLRRSLDYYRAQFGGATIDRILLCGGGARVPGVIPALSTELDLPVATASPFADMRLAPEVDGDLAREQGPQFVVAVGLALRGMV